MDRLGKLVIRDLCLLQNSSLPSLFLHRRGDSNITDLASLTTLRHPAHHLVRHIGARGFPVTLHTAPWSIPQRDSAVARGPHKSSHDFVSFLREELADMVERATWMVLPYHRLRELHDLRISPMGVVPQHERRPRPIVDYTFSGVNRDTLPLSPREAMQFGRALERIISQVVHSNPHFGPVHFIKLDIADGFYRVWLRLEDIPKLAVSIPSLPGEPPLLALPLALPMGWTQSPPAFCAVTETIADVANHRLHRRYRTSAHRLDPVADMPPPLAPAVASRPIPAPASVPLASSVPTTPPPAVSFLRRPLRAVDVFVDDFIGLAQGGPAQLRHVRRTLMQSVDDVFRPLSSDDNPHRTEPISVSKLRKGDGSWATCKTVLGWVIDSVAMTLTLPPRRLLRLAELLADIPSTQRRLSLDRWHRLLGELRSMSLALPGARGLFSHLQSALRSRLRHTRLRLTPGFHHALDDFRWLQSNLDSRPTRLFELVPTHPVAHGFHDASAMGAGGVWFPQPGTSGRLHRARILERDGTWHRIHPRTPGPTVWRCPFPPHVTAALASFDNPAGTINNSELELLGHFWHVDVAASTLDVRERTIRSSTDNAATLFWARKGSVTTTSPTATILRHLSLHQRFHRFVNQLDFVAGTANSMADAASRLFHLNDRDFLTFFNSTFPQTVPWRLCTLPPTLISAGISALRMQTCSPASFLPPLKPRQLNGQSGPTIVHPYPSTLPFKTVPIPSLSSRCSPTATAGDSSTPVGARSVVAPLKVPYGALAKRLRQWGPRTLASTPTAMSTIGSGVSSPPIPALTNPPSSV